jgi:hypothetical protein
MPPPELARNSSRCAADDTFGNANVRSTAPQQQSVQHTGDADRAVAGTDVVGTAMRRCGRNGGADRRLLAWRQCVHPTAVRPVA